MMIAVTVLSPDAPDERPARGSCGQRVRSRLRISSGALAIALAWLALMVLFKCADALRCRYRQHFCFVCRRFSQAQIGVITKIFGSGHRHRRHIFGGCGDSAVGRVASVAGRRSSSGPAVNLGYIWLMYQRSSTVALHRLVISMENLTLGFLGPRRLRFCRRWSIANTRRRNTRCFRRWSTSPARCSGIFAGRIVAATG